MVCSTGSLPEQCVAGFFAICTGCWLIRNLNESGLIKRDRSASESAVVLTNVRSNIELGYTHTERQQQRLKVVNGDAWKWGGGQFSSVRGESQYISMDSWCCRCRCHCCWLSLWALLKRSTWIDVLKKTTKKQTPQLSKSGLWTFLYSGHELWTSVFIDKRIQRCISIKLLMLCHSFLCHWSLHLDKLLSLREVLAKFL